MSLIGNRPSTMPQQSVSFRITGNSAEENISRRKSIKAKGKEREVSEPPSPSLYTFIPRPPSISGMSGVTSAPTSPKSKRSSVLSTASTSSSRSSTLLDFSSFSFGRKKKPPPPRQNPNLRMNLVLPDVLEISAANNIHTPTTEDGANPLEDEEVRERNRLREEAAQALGLSTSTIGHQSISDDQFSDSGHSVASNGTLRNEEGRFNLEDARGQPPNNHRSPLTSTTSLHPTSAAPTSQTHGRGRSGSMPPLPIQSPFPPSLTQHHNASDSTSPLSPLYPVPSFPSTPRALASFIQTTSSGTLPKYYPSSSLRIFAMNKQWKARHLILTSPTNVTVSSNPLSLTSISNYSTTQAHVSYLHLFKSSSADERELERLEINEDSVVFVSEEEVGGKKGVVQVAGVDVGFVNDSTIKKENARERVKGREQVMWLFYIVDPLEKQRWIESIKNKVFGQRTIRAGLGSSPPSSGLNEPRGDMDVMMSMRAQGILSSPTTHTSPTRSSFSNQDFSNGHSNSPRPQSPTSPSHGDAASVASTKSSKHTRPSSSGGKHTSGAVLSLKGLFGNSKTSVGHTSGRQRSGSRASGIDEMDDLSGRATVERSDSVVSVGSVGSSKSVISKSNNLISILQASSSTFDPSFASNMGVHPPVTDFAALGINHSPQTPKSQLDRKILQTPLVGNENDGTSKVTRSLLFSGDTGIISDASAGASPTNAASSKDRRREHRTFSIGEAYSLQPPPRKRWTSNSEIFTPPVSNTPQSHHLQLQESPYIRDHRNLDDTIDVLGGTPNINRISSGNLTPEPINGSSPVTKRASGHSSYSFSFGTPPGSGNLETHYRPRSVSSRSARSARSGMSGMSGDTGEQELEELDVPAGGIDGPPPTSSRTRRPSEGSGFGDNDKRASISSGKRSSMGVASGKRLSRQLPKRLTPPSGPPPATPTTPPSGSPTKSLHSGVGAGPLKTLSRSPQSHPYSGAATERRLSTMTTRSNASSRSSVVSNLPSFSKRASVSSAISGLSTNSTHIPGNATPLSVGSQLTGSGISAHSRASSSHRSSVAPPPRPAPTFALPPAPGESPSPADSSPSTPSMSTTHNRSSFRDSIASRTFRLSLMAPKPPPSSVLPPRPDEIEHPKSPTSSLGSRHAHRRSLSGNNSLFNGANGSLYSIPGSPVAPPNIPASLSTLEPPSNGANISSPMSRAASIKSRLRILSMPSPTLPSPVHSTVRPTTLTSPLKLTPSTPPGTPPTLNGSVQYLERHSHDSSQPAATPTSPSIPAPKVHHLEPESEPELPSLPPPPRRGSKRISLPEVEPISTTQEDEPVPVPHNDVNKPFSLSRPASVVSFGVVNV